MPNGVFDNVQFTKYTPTYVGVPVEQFIQTATALNQRYEQAVDTKDRIHSMLANTTVADVNQKHLATIANNINNDLKNFVANGNWEDAGLVIKDTAQKNIMANPVYKGIITDYANRQAFMKEIEEGVTKGTYSREWADDAMAMQFKLIGGKAVEVDENGGLKNVFKGIAPPEEISLPDLYLKIGKEVQDATTIGALHKHPVLQGHWERIIASGKDPMVIKDLLDDYIANDPKTKSYLNYKAQLDYFKTHYTETKDANGNVVGSYTPITADELTALGAHIVTKADVEAEKANNPFKYLNSLTGTNTSGLSTIQEGDVRLYLGKVEILDEKGNGTGKYKDAYTDPYANINSGNLVGIWKELDKIKTANLPMDSAIKALSQQKLDVKDIKDDAWFMYQEWAREDEKDARNKVPLTGITLLTSNTSDYKSITDITNAKLAYTNDYMAQLKNEIAQSDLPKGQRDRLFVMLQAGWDGQRIANYVGREGAWTNLGYVLQKVKERDVHKNAFDITNNLDKNARLAAGLDDKTSAKIEEQAEKIYQQYLKTKVVPNVAINKELNKILDEMIHPNEGFFNRFNPFRSMGAKTVTDPDVQHAMKSAIRTSLLKEGGYLTKYNNYLEEDSKRTIPRTFMSFGNMTKEQNAAIAKALQETMYNNINETGVLQLSNAKTGKQLSHDEREAFVNGEYVDIRWDTDPKTGEMVFAVKPIASKNKNGTFEQADYITVRGLTGVDSWLSQFPGMATLMSYKHSVDRFRNSPGELMPLYSQSVNETKDQADRRSRVFIRTLTEKEKQSYDPSTMPTFLVIDTKYNDQKVVSSEEELYRLFDKHYGSK